MEVTTWKRQRGSDNVEATTWKRQRGSDNVEMAGGVMHTINNRVAVKIFEENLNTVPLEKRDNVEMTCLGFRSSPIIFYSWTQIIDRSCCLMGDLYDTLPETFHLRHECTCGQSFATTLQRV